MTSSELKRQQLGPHNCHLLQRHFDESLGERTVERRTWRGRRYRFRAKGAAVLGAAVMELHLPNPADAIALHILSMVP